MTQKAQKLHKVPELEVLVPQSAQVEGAETDDDTDLSEYVSYEDVAERLSKTPKKQQQKEPTVMTHSVLDEAWRTLAKALQPHIRDSVRFNAALLRIPEWQLVCGLLVHLWQSASMTSPVLDPSWQSETPVQQDEAACQECGKVFVPKWRNQAYCSQECGLKAEHKRYIMKA